MTKKEKLLKKLKSNPKDFNYDELKTFLSGLGYEEISKGKTSGSRVAFYNQKSEHIIRLHKPHPSKILKVYQINEIINELKITGALK